MRSNRLFLLGAVMVFLVLASVPACQTMTPIASAPSAVPTPIGEGPTSGGTEVPPSLNADEQLATVDDILRQTAKASIAYNAPSEMRMNETVTIELLLNPKLSEEKLKEQISEPGAVITSDVEITPLMKAKLLPQDKSAFSIDAQPDEEHAIQVISGTDTTKWSWNVTAQKPGTHRMTISLSRLVKYDGKDFWREVGEYKADIVVQVTPLDWLQNSGWIWIASLVMILAVVFVFRNIQQKSGKRRTGRAGENLGRIFISYRRADSADIAGRIYDSLVDKFGRGPIFKDVDSIPLGVDYKEYLDRKVRECRVLLAIIGDRWLDASDEARKRRLDDPADFVRIEIESALACGIPVIPLLVRGAQIPAEKDLPGALKKLIYKNGIQIRPDPDFHNDMERLVSALKEYME